VHQEVWAAGYVLGIRRWSIQTREVNGLPRYPFATLRLADASVGTEKRLLGRVKNVIVLVEPCDAQRPCDSVCDHELALGLNVRDQGVSHVIRA
jgi:hypothetical protein